MSVGASIVVAHVGSGGVLRDTSDVPKCSKLDMFERHEHTASVDVTLLIAPLVSTPMGFMQRVKRDSFVLQRATKPVKVGLLRPSPGWPPNPSDLGPGICKASGSSRCSRRRQ